jgi:CHAT domain-containing protein/Tfp pilus assembly protein PilF
MQNWLNLSDEGYRIMKRKGIVKLFVSVFLFFSMLITFVPKSQASSNYQTTTPEPEDTRNQATLLFNEAFSLVANGLCEESLDKAKKAFELFKSMGDLENAADTKTVVGLGYFCKQDFDLALEAQQDAYVLADLAKSDRVKVDALMNLAEIYFKLGDTVSTESNYKKAIQLCEGLDTDNAKDNIAYANFRLGQYFLQIDEYQISKDYYLESIKYYELIPTNGELAILEADLGSIEQNLGNYDSALIHYEKSFKEISLFDDKNSLARVLHNIGGTYNLLGKFDSGFEKFEEALRIINQYNINDPLLYANIIVGEGVSYEYKGEYKKALEYYLEAKTIQENNKYWIEYVKTQMALGSIYTRLGEFDSAEESFTQAEKYLNDINAPDVLAEFYNEFGIMHKFKGDNNSALAEYKKAEIIFRDLGKIASEIVIINNIGEMYQLLGENEYAEQKFKQAEKLARSNGFDLQLCNALIGLSSIYYSESNFDAAKKTTEEALKLAIKNNDLTMEWIALANIARLYEVDGNVDEAIKKYIEVINIIESIRENIYINDLKTSYMLDKLQIYQQIVKLLIDTNDYERAYEFVERSKARSLLDQLNSGNIDFRDKLDQSAFAKENYLLQQISSRRNQLNELKKQLSITKDDTQITQTINEVTSEIKRLEEDYQNNRIETQSLSPQLNALLPSKVLSINEVKAILDENTIMVEYYILPNKVLAFIISSNDFNTVEIPVTEKELTNKITDFQTGILEKNDRSYSDLRELYNFIFQPIEDVLDELSVPPSTIVIVPHGILYYVPFLALSDGKTYLNERFNLTQIPSASLYKIVIKKTNDEFRTILAIGNPKTEEVGAGNLKNAEDEVNLISKLFGSDPKTRDKATETTVLDQASANNILHIAAHSSINSNNPLFYSLLLSPDTKNDGYLTVHEIYNLDLSLKTSLVVLSSCQSLVGNVINSGNFIQAGDEIEGFSRAFIYSGTPSLISSLWIVDDESTGYLMQRFYTYLLEGSSKAEALKKAQLDTRERFPHPYNWAAFVLTGDSGKQVKPIESSSPTLPNTLATEITSTPEATNRSWPHYLVVAIPIIFLALIIMYIYKKIKK